MRLTTTLCLTLLACLPVFALADHDDEKMEHEIIIEATGEMDLDEQNRILQQVEGDIRSGEERRVIIVKDDDGKVTVRRFNGGEPMGMRHIDRPEGMMMGHANAMRAPRRGPPGDGRMHGNAMNEATAQCVLKYIAKVNSDAAAHLLHRACDALNPSPKSPSPE